MAKATDGLTEVHMRGQLGLRAATLRDIIRLFPMWDPFDAASFDAFVEAVVLLAQQRGRNSAALAARYFETYRNVDLGLTAGKAAALAEPASRKAIEAGIRATAVSGFWNAIGAGMTTEQAKRQAVTQLTGSVSRHVLNTGRDTLLANIRRESRYHGWIRVSDGDPCPFCAMLIARGPVYWTEASAGGFSQWHDHCCCSVKPFKDGDGWPALNSKMADLWRKTRAEITDSDRKTTNPAYTAFRRAIEGRATG